MTTAREIVTKALRKNGTLGRGMPLEAEEANEAFDDLNNMLSSWSTDSMLLYARTWENFSLVANDGEYTIGTSQDLNTVRPMFIVESHVRLGTTDYPLASMTDEAYAAVAQKAQVGMPRFYNFDNGFSVARIRLWPVPDQTYTIYLLTEKALTAFASLDTVVSLPPGWEQALVFNLAIITAPDAGVGLDENVRDIAISSKSAIRRTIMRNRTMDYPQTGRVGNILTGWN